MKKLASFTVAVGLMASLAATASAAEVTGTATDTTNTTTTTTTVTGSTYSNQFETIITPADLKPATPQIILTTATPFHFSMDDTITPAGWLSPQTVDTTGNILTDVWGYEWREIYTWMGKAWIKVPETANVVTP